MLHWLDSVWSVFLDEIESLKKAVYVKVGREGQGQGSQERCCC
jgi:hypothetical protein